MHDPETIMSAMQMDLRDYFAAQALLHTATLAPAHTDKVEEFGGAGYRMDAIEYRARMAYLYADAMMKARTLR